MESFSLYILVVHEKMPSQTWHDHLRQSAKYLYVFLIPTQPSSKCFFFTFLKSIYKKNIILSPHFELFHAFFADLCEDPRACSQSSEFISITIHHRTPSHSDNAVIHLRLVMSNWSFKFQA